MQVRHLLRRSAEASLRCRSLSQLRQLAAVRGRERAALTLRQWGDLELHHLASTLHQQCKICQGCWWAVLCFTTSVKLARASGAKATSANSIFQTISDTE